MKEVDVRGIVITKRRRTKGGKGQNDTFSIIIPNLDVWPLQPEDKVSHRITITQILSPNQQTSAISLVLHPTHITKDNALISAS